MKNNGKYDYIVVLCPEINLEDKGIFKDFKHGLYLGGMVRMKAAAEIHKKDKKVTLILVADYNKESEGKGNYYRKSLRTDSMREYLLRAGVGRENMIIINSLPCTRHNLVAVFNVFKNKFKNKNVALLTNKYHLPRSLAFWLDLKKVSKYKNIPLRPYLLSAEDITGDKAMYKNKKMYADRLKIEKQGLLDFASGDYRDGCIIRGRKEKWNIRKGYRRIIEEKKNKLLTADEIRNLK